MAEVIARRDEKWPRWFWLLSASQGLVRFEPVEQEILHEDYVPGKGDVEITGRGWTKPNSMVSGWADPDGLFGGRNQAGTATGDS